MLENRLLELGAPVLARLIGQRFGKGAELVAHQALTVLVQTLGIPETTDRVSIEAAIAANSASIKSKVAEAEKRMPDLLIEQAQTSALAAEAAALEKSMAELIPSETKPLWAWAWLYLWQYLLMLIWCWALAGVHIANGVFGQAFPAPAIADLLTLTGLYLGLHMGGHTVLEMVRGKWGRSGEEATK